MIPKPVPGRQRLEAEAFIRAFIAAPYVDELLELVPRSPDRALSTVRTLGSKLDAETIIAVDHPDDDVVPLEVLRTLRSLGAGDECWVIGCDVDHAGVEPLRWVVTDVVGFAPMTLVSCIRGELAFFEDFGGRHLVLSRPATPRETVLARSPDEDSLIDTSFPRSTE